MPIPVEPKKHNISIRLYEPPVADKNARAKILLLKLDHIGDFIISLDAFRIIREAFRDAEITLICLPAVVKLAESTGLFDYVKGFVAVTDSAQLGKLPGMYEEDRIARFQALLDGPYFLAADFRHDADGRFWLDHIDARYRAGFAAKIQKGLDITIPTMEWDVPQPAVAFGKNLPPHAGVRLKLLAHEIVDALQEKTLVGVDFKIDPALEQSETYRALSAQQGPKIGLSTGAGSELRKWSNDYWIMLLQKLQREKNAHFVFFGAGDSDVADTDILTATLPPGSFTNLVGQMPLHQLPAIMQKLDAYIGCDTGLTHLAGGLGLPVVNIYAGISNASVWRARGPRVKTVYAEVVCAPCHLRFKSECPNNNICMGAIVPDIVYACVEQLKLG